MTHAHRRVAGWFTGVIAALSLAGVATGVRASVDEFHSGPGVRALADRATGVYEIGSIDFGGPVITLQALIQNGEVLQIHGRRAGTWLAKRTGSHGGKPVAPPKFDELVTIGGGLNRDIRRAAAIVQRDFARAADLTLLNTANAGTTPAASSCGATGCRMLFKLDVPAAGSFQVSVSADRTSWSFEGYGIVAIWAMPGD